MTVPTREVVSRWLRQLAAGEIDRSEAAAFARPWVSDRDRESEDEALWSPLALLAGADLEVAPSEFLYGVEDFEVWREAFERSVRLKVDVSYGGLNSDELQGSEQVDLVWAP